MSEFRKVVDRSTSYRWVGYYAPKFQNRSRRVKFGIEVAIDVHRSQ